MNTLKKNNILPVAIIGAGPVGLAAAAHLLDRDIPFILFEMGNEVGFNISTWSHVSVFSQWKYNIDKVAKKLLIKNHIELPEDEAIATGEDIIQQYLKPLSMIKGIQENINLNAKVLSIGRKGLDKMKTGKRDILPFSIRVEQKKKLISMKLEQLLMHQVHGIIQTLLAQVEFLLQEKKSITKKYTTVCLI